jgi:hypothetical protein
VLSCSYLAKYDLEYQNWVNFTDEVRPFLNQLWAAVLLCLQRLHCCPRALTLLDVARLRSNKPSPAPNISTGSELSTQGRLTDPLHLFSVRLCADPADADLPHHD